MNLCRTLGGVALALLLAFSPGAARAFEVIVRDDAGAPVADVAVALYPHGPQKAGAREERDEVQQKDRLFSPYVTVVRKDARVSFPNKDRTRHHVYSFSKAKKFDLPLFLGNSKDVVFDAEGVVALGCNIHDWMLGYVVVVDTPWHGKTDAEGLARLGPAPDGAYTLKYWYPGMKGKEIVTLDDNVQASQKRYTVTIPAGSVQPLPRKPPNAADYDG